MARIKVRMDEVQQQDKIVDLDVDVLYSEPYNDSWWSLECSTKGQTEYDGAYLRILLPNEHKISVERA